MQHERTTVLPIWLFVVPMIVKQMIRIFWVVLLFVSCHQAGQERKKSDADNLVSIEDSMETNPSYARKLLDAGMKNAKDSLTYYEYMSRLGKYYYLSATPDSMEPLVDSVVRFASQQPQSPRRNSLLAYAYNCQAINFHLFHKESSDAVKLYRQAYDLLRESDAPEQLPDVSANLGDAYVFENDLPSAAAWYRKALFLVDSLQLPKERNASLYMGLGRIYLLLDDFDASLKCYRNTEPYFEGMSLNLKAYFLTNYGNYYYYSKDYATSLKKFLQLKTLLEEYGKEETYSMYLCQLNLADLYLNLGNLDVAERYLDKVEPYMQANKDVVALYYCNTIRIGIAVKRGNLARVESLLAKEGAHDDMDFSLRQIRNRYLREYDEKKGDYRKAYLNLVEDNRMNDSLEHNRANMRSTDVMQRFAQDTLLLHHQIAIEHKNAEIQESRAIILAVVGLLVILSLVIALLIILARRKVEKDKLSIMQLKLDGVRNRISPHFVFNVLNNKIVNSDKKEATELLGLSKLIRANLDMSCKMAVSLKEELDFVRQYVEVESRLMDDELKFEVRIAEGIDEERVKLPSMLVQILTENALVHGLRGWEGTKCLTIEVERNANDVIRISVLDNGPGFDARTMMGKHRIGLNIIGQTMSVINERNKSKMSFQMHNRTRSDGTIAGCEAILMIPQKIQYLS